MNFFLSLLWLISSLSVSLHASEFWFQSDVMVPGTAKLRSATLTLPSRQPQVIESSIRKQLHYLIGPLNDDNAAPSLGMSLNLENLSVKELSDGDFLITYDASFQIAWDKSTPLTSPMEVYLPRRVDSHYLEALWAHYQPTCSLPFDEGFDSFFFYFRPQLPGCILNDAPRVQPEFLTPNALDIRLTPQASHQLLLPHHLIWKDKRLKATFFFAETDEEGFPTGGEEFSQSLVAHYGPPLHQTKFSSHYYTITWNHFHTPQGVLETHIYDLLQGDITGAPPVFYQRLNQSLSHSDFVAYNAHAGYGKKIDFFTSLWGFQVGPYKLVYLNGCDTFSYIDGKLLNLPFRIDLLTTGLSSYFSLMPTYSLEVLDSLMEKDVHYLSLIKRIPIGVPILLGSFQRGGRAPTLGP